MNTELPYTCTYSSNIHFTMIMRIKLRKLDPSFGDPGMKEDGGELLDGGGWEAEDLE